MNDQDFRDACAMLAMLGIVMRGIDSDIVDDVAKNAFFMADAMVEARKAKPEEEGILAIKPTKKTTRKG